MLMQKSSFLELKYFLPISDRVILSKMLLELLFIPDLDMRLQGNCANLLITLLG